MEKETKPLSPSDIMSNIGNIIPSVVIEAVNNILTKKFRGTEVTIKEKDIIYEIKRMTESEMTADEIYDNKWMDFEEIYRNNGWDVTYDSPAYRENYDPYFTFTPKTKK